MEKGRLFTPGALLLVQVISAELSQQRVYSQESLPRLMMAGPDSVGGAGG